MIQAEELYRTLHRKPFQPFRVCLKDGRVFDIRFEHLAIVGQTFFQIGIPEANPTEPTYPLYEYVVSVALADITRVEDLTATASAIN